MAIITELMVINYQANLRLAAQQMSSKLTKAVMHETGIVGKSSSPVTIISPRVASKLTGRNQDTVYTNSSYDRRWYEPTPYTLAELYDWADAKKVGGEYDPKSGILKSFTSSLGRACDDRILTSMFATAKIGEEGASTEAFDTSNQQVALATGGANSGLNVAKIKAGLEILQSNDIDEDEEIFMAITARQNKELLAEIQVINTDYRFQVQISPTGRLESFMGVQFIHIQYDKETYWPDSYTALLSTGNYLCPMWCKSGVALGTWKDIDGKMTEMPNKNYAIQIYARNMIGATRTENPKVVQIICYGS